jgi:hypothetical protein
MTTVVIMPGGFHPFHAGHAALYNSARRAFPDAEVFVAATNDTSARPFSFAVKEKLAKLAGVEPGHFVQVKSPFRAEEITSQFNPDQDRIDLCAVRKRRHKATTGRWRKERWITCVPATTHRRSPTGTLCPACLHGLPAHCGVWAWHDKCHRDSLSMATVE